MDFIIALKTREATLATALQARLLLQDVSLFECEAAGAGPPIRTVEPVRLNAQLDSELEPGAETELNFSVTLRVYCEDPLVFHIEATVLVRYRLADGVKPASKPEIESFRKSHALLAAWPYLREFVQSTAARMALPTEPLPVLRLVLR
jgi:hypothetical protein